MADYISTHDFAEQLEFALYPQAVPEESNHS